MAVESGRPRKPHIPAAGRQGRRLESPDRRPGLSFRLYQFGLVSPQCVLDQLQRGTKLATRGGRLDLVDNRAEDLPLVGIQAAGRALLDRHADLFRDCAHKR